MQAPTHNTPYHSRREERAPRKVNWWLRVTSSGWDKPQETIEQRESTRRSQLLSWILLGECVALAGFIPTVFTSLPALAMILIAAFTMLIVIWLNRTGLIVVAGILQVIVSISVTFGVLLASPDGALHLYYLPAYDFLAVTVLMSASILPRLSAFIVAGIDVIGIYANLLLQPQAADLRATIHTYTLPAVAARPVVLLILTAIVAYLWVRGMDQAVKRADRAEEIHALEQYLNQVEAEHTARVKEFVQEMIKAIGALANGQEGLLMLPPGHPWEQQASFINVQLRQFHRLKQVRRGDSDQLIFAEQTLLRLLQRINAGQSPVSALDPQRFTTRVPITDEIVKYLYALLQKQQTSGHKAMRPPYNQPGRPPQG